MCECHACEFRIRLLRAVLSFRSSSKKEVRYHWTEPEDDLYNHYEGASEVSGTYEGKPVKGYSYVELIGDWTKKN